MKRAVIYICMLMFSVYSVAQIPESQYFLARNDKGSGGSSSGTAVENTVIGLNKTLGGYVFYVTPDGIHGLVAATQDQAASSDWYSAQDAISNPANHNADGKKYTDWRLPTNYELNLMYNQKAAIGGFVEAYYWSSVMNGINYAWLKNFGNGSTDFGSRDSNNHVRAVRAF